MVLQCQREVYISYDRVMSLRGSGRCKGLADSLIMESQYIYKCVDNENAALSNWNVVA